MVREGFRRGLMGKPKLKVNAKSFVRDYRAGLSDDDLMDTYNLSRDSLDKLLTMLVDKNLLDASEVKSSGAFPATELVDDPTFGGSPSQPRPKPFVPAKPETVDRKGPEPKPAGVHSGSAVDSSQCPQCSAEITDKMLICPECGHVLPGEERWANVEPQPRLLDRIPPKVLGTVVALPIAVVLFFVFKDIILPMTDKTIENSGRTIQRREANSQRRAGSETLPTKEQANANLDKLLDDLISGKILVDVDEDLTVFYVGPRWLEMSGDERLRILDRLRLSMILIMEEFECEVVDGNGRTVAWMSPRSVEIVAQ